MDRRKFLFFMILVLAAAGLLLGVDQGRAATTGPVPGVNYDVPNYANSPLPAVTRDPVTGAVLSVTGGMRKFVDKLPLLGPAGANNLGQYIPVATADNKTYPGSDYYEIALVEYTERMHSDLPVTGTKLRGYVQEVNGVPVDNPHYLGPLIIATKDRPVRIKFTNRLPVGSAGNLFLPVDTTIMGAGPFTIGDLANPASLISGNFTQNRATLHLHGGNTPWVSDGTAHQWITPAGEATSYPVGMSQQNVPDMPLPSGGSATFYWTNQQSGRLMFYHDHAYGLTGPDVYAGEAAGYLLVDPVERALTDGTTAGIAAMPEIPLVIQDKTFVPNAAQLAATDPLWDNVLWGGEGNLWYPHVYMPNQDPWAADLSGAAPFGRWDYGPWFWPIFPAPDNVPVVSHVPEAFMDTPVVNGTAYPYIDVQPKAYRFRILDAATDRFWNLQLYVADNTVFAADGRANTEVRMVPFSGPNFPASGYTCPSGGMTPISTAYPVSFPCAGGVMNTGWGQQDNRSGGVPDPATRGPAMIQIGTEGGLLPAPAVVVNQPVNYDYDRRSITVLNVLEHALFLGPAERADVVIDFSKFAGKTLILYNDSPAPVPALDPRIDYYTGNPDLTSSGGAPSTVAGFGPNTRTVMQIRVAAGADSSAPPDGYDNNVLTALKTALPAAFASTQDRPIVAESVFNTAYGAAFTDQYARIFTGASLQPTVTWTDGFGAPKTYTVPGTTPAPPIVDGYIFNKTIQELFDTHGRMNATLGVELPFTSATIQTTIPLGFIDPTTETFADGETQIWKITHNGVDTHAIHFHLFNVQVINRVGWDGMIKPPDPNELGWKDTVRMNPLEDVVVAIRAKSQKLPFGIPESNRPLDVTAPLGSTMGFTGVDPATGAPMPVSNVMANFGWEYTWHCHLLGHEENDMMRPLVLTVASVVPVAPVLSIAAPGPPFVLTWTDNTPVTDPATLGNPGNEIGFRIERATGAGAFATMGTAPANTTTYTDTTAAAGTTYRYRVSAFNAAGSSSSNIVTVGLSPPAAPTGLAAAITGPTRITLTWTDASNNEMAFAVWRSANGGAFARIGTVGRTAAQSAATGGTVTYNNTTNLISGTTYRYYVTAVNAVGASAPSNTVSVVFSPLVVPAAPGNLTASTVNNGTTDSVTLNWIDNSNNETNFLVQMSPNGGTNWYLAATLPANTTTYTQKGLPRLRTFLYRVGATNAAGTAWSNAVTVVTP